MIQALTMDRFKGLKEEVIKFKTGIKTEAELEPT
jgi:hypothetical protein